MTSSNTYDPTGAGSSDGLRGVKILLVEDSGIVGEAIKDLLELLGADVVGRTGWQTHALSDGSGLQKVDPTRAPISTALGVLGMPGMTAYMGLLEIGKPAAGWS